jgi:hypothetical protein
MWPRTDGVVKSSRGIVDYDRLGIKLYLDAHVWIALNQVIEAFTSCVPERTLTDLRLLKLSVG